MKSYVAFFLALSLSVSVFAKETFTNLDTYKKQLGFTPYYSMENGGRQIRIAILDKGFAGYEKQIGRTLPENTRYVAGPVSSPTTKENHGLKMAEILTALMTDDGDATQWEPDLILYNVYGYSNFKAAIDDMIKSHVDLVLYSEVWEYGGNHDGRGFINAEVNRATSAGIIWVNAAGNFAKTTYNSSIRTNKGTNKDQNNWVHLPDQNQSLAIYCEGGLRTKCQMKIVLSWNDFKDDVQRGTDKDLDLELVDDFFNVIQSSKLKQTKGKAEDKPGYSKYPREIIQAEVSPGAYFIRVKDSSGNFGSEDRLRITVDGQKIVMPSHSREETLLNPADNTSVITVGASDSDRSSSSAKLKKPDLLVASAITTSGDEEYRGSSNSAAIVAAGLGILKSQQPKWTRKDLLEAVQRNQGNWEQRGLSLQVLAFGPTGPGCFSEAAIGSAYPYAQEVIRQGGVPVMTTAAVRIMVPFDPVQLGRHLRRSYINDMIVVLPHGGYAVFPRFAPIPHGAIEIFQRPLEAGLCQESCQGDFRLPVIEGGDDEQLPPEPIPAKARTRG